MWPAIAVGIDLGSSNSKVSILREDGVVEVISLGPSPPIWSTFVEPEDKDGGCPVGQIQALVNPTNGVFAMIRLVGKKFEDKEVQAASVRWPFEVIDVDGKPEFQIQFNNKRKIEDQGFSPEELVALLIGKLKRSAEAYLEGKITEAVITVPAVFTSFQRWLVVNAAKAVKINVRRIISSSTAAGLGFGFEYQEKSERNILVFDVGGGTTNVSILTIQDGIFEVRASAGNISLGGEDFTRSLVEFFLDECIRGSKSRMKLCRRNHFMMHLRNACELAKIDLSSSTSTTIECTGYGGSRRSKSITDFKVHITREKFEEMNKHHFSATLVPIQQALNDAKMTKSEIDEVVLVGGSTRIPKLRNMTKEFFNGKILNTSLKPEEASALGAGLQASIICAIRPREIHDEILLLDTLPYDLGYESYGGIMNPILRKNTLIPTTMTKIVSNINGIGNTIRIFEGQSTKTAENTFLGELRGIPCSSSKSSSGVLITFDVSCGDWLTVKASDSGLENQIDIPEFPTELSEAKITRNKTIRSCIYRI